MFNIVLIFRQVYELICGHVSLINASSCKQISGYFEGLDEWQGYYKMLESNMSKWNNSWLQHAAESHQCNRIQLLSLWSRPTCWWNEKGFWKEYQSINIIFQWWVLELIFEGSLRGGWRIKGMHYCKINGRQWEGKAGILKLGRLTNRSFFFSFFFFSLFL